MCYAIGFIEFDFLFWVIKLCQYFIFALQNKIPADPKVLYGFFTLTYLIMNKYFSRKLIYARRFGI